MAKDHRFGPHPTGPRLRQARQAAGYRTAREFADTHDIPQPTYTMHELGKRALKRETAVRYAKALNISLEWLMTGNGKGPSESPALRPIATLEDVPVVGHVQAGEWQEALELDEQEWRYVPVALDPEYPEVKRFGLKVLGPSMNKLYPEGTVLICIGLHDIGEDPRPGDKVICQRRRKDGLIEATVKEYVLEADGSHWLYPRSTDPRFQQPWPLEKPGDDDDNDDVQIVAIVTDALIRQRPR